MQRASDRWISIALSLLLHGVLVALLVYGWWMFRERRRAAPTPPIDATVIDARTLKGPSSLRHGRRPLRSRQRPPEEWARRQPTPEERAAREQAEQARRQAQEQKAAAAARGRRTGRGREGGGGRRPQRKRRPPSRQRAEKAAAKAAAERAPAGGAGPGASARRTSCAASRRKSMPKVARNGAALASWESHDRGEDHACVAAAADGEVRDRLHVERDPGTGGRSDAGEHRGVQRRSGGARVDRGRGVPRLAAPSAAGSVAVRSQSQDQTSSRIDGDGRASASQHTAPVGGAVGAARGRHRHGCGARGARGAADRDHLRRARSDTDRDRAVRARAPGRRRSRRRGRGAARPRGQRALQGAAARAHAGDADARRGDQRGRLEGRRQRLRRGGPPGGARQRYRRGRLRPGQHADGSTARDAALHRPAGRAAQRRAQGERCHLPEDPRGARRVRDAYRLRVGRRQPRPRSTTS